MGGTGIQVPLTGISSYTLQQSGSAVTRQSTVQQQEDHFITKDFSPFTIFPGQVSSLVKMVLTKEVTFE